ncbi:MAG TPA: Rrf2 family transcriptional regulator [Candidatus Limnocylindrales bacterium]|nr:Rrf2 family transcriptional regulator [Candidatus Limnocylindrales bacterium]
MRLTDYTDYGLRVLVYLGTTGDRLVTIDEIAGHSGISRNHLMKIVHRLGQLGYVATVRGKNGGVRLGAPPAKIKVGDVVRDLEEELGTMTADAPKKGPALQPADAVRAVLQDAFAAFARVLDDTSLADLVEPCLGRRSRGTR